MPAQKLPAARTRSRPRTTAGTLLAATLTFLAGCTTSTSNHNANPLAAATFSQPETAPSNTPATKQRTPIATPGTPATPPAPAIPVGVPGGPTLDLPAHAAPAPELAPLAFMAGRWISVTPNKLINTEHWTTPRGNHMLGTFRQIRRDSKPAFVELSLITVDPDGITLTLRHLHARLEVPERRKDVSIFKLKSAKDNTAEFTGTGAADQVTAVIYKLVAPNELHAEVQFAPDSKEKPFTTKYIREE
jgi:hypothetical protein